MTVFGGLFKWFHSRLNDKANKETTDKLFDQILDELKEQRTEMNQHKAEDREMHRDVLRELQTVNSNLATTNASLANLAGRFDGMRK